MTIETNADLAELIGKVIEEEVANERQQIRDNALENARLRDKLGFGDEKVDLYDTLWFDSNAQSVAHNVVRRLLKLGLIRLPGETAEG